MKNERYHILFCYVILFSAGKNITNFNNIVYFHYFSLFNKFKFENISIIIKIGNTITYNAKDNQYSTALTNKILISHTLASSITIT
jgi:hypothetical protein